MEFVTFLFKRWTWLLVVLTNLPVEQTAVAVVRSCVIGPLFIREVFSFFPRQLSEPSWFVCVILKDLQGLMHWLGKRCLKEHDLVGVRLHHRFERMPVKWKK